MSVCGGIHGALGWTKPAGDIGWPVRAFEIVSVQDEQHWQQLGSVYLETCEHCGLRGVRMWRVEIVKHLVGFPPEWQRVAIESARNGNVVEYVEALGALSKLSDALAMGQYLGMPDDEPNMVSYKRTRAARAGGL